MLAKNGNLLEVYQEIARRAEHEAMMVEERQGPFAAEILSGSAPAWHLVRTAPARETLAAAHLVGRRFATYLPTFGRDDVLPISGKVKAGKPMFPGYLFLFVWNIHAHWRRILGCPGVANVVVIDERPVVVPDRVIDEIQVLEVLNGKLDDACRAGKRGWRKRRRDGSLPAGRQTVTISTPSAFGGLAGLDDATRISVLHEALGLASNASASVEEVSANGRWPEPA